MVYDILDYSPILTLPSCFCVCDSSPVQKLWLVKKSGLLHDLRTQSPDLAQALVTQWELSAASF